MNETYQDAKLLAMGILNYINAFDEQGGNKHAMSRCLWEAAMQMFEDHQAGLTEFVREDEVYALLYDIASDFYEWTLELKDEREEQ